MAKFYSDFSEFADSAALLAEFVPGWETSGFIVDLVDDAGAVGGKYVRLDRGGGALVPGLYWSSVGSVLGDVEIVVKARTTSLSFQRFRIVLHSNLNTSDPRTAYFTAVFSHNIRAIDKYVDGVFTSLAATDVANQNVIDTWYWTRLQRTGTTIRSRMWLDGDPEPAVWECSATDADLTAGYVGFAIESGSGENDFDVIGVGTGGDAAPMAPFETVLEATTILEVESVAALQQIHYIAATTIIEIDAPFKVPTDLAATTIIEIDASAAPASANNLSATTIIEVETSAALQQDTNLSATTIIEVDSFERYTGPGTGLLVDDPAERDLTALVNRLREGDHQLVMLSQAGVEGINGVMRVLGRSLDDAGGRQKITPHFVPLPDPTLPLKQRGGKGPSVKPRQSDNIFRQVKDQQRQINRRSRE